MIPGAGFTVMVKVRAVPVQPFAVGVMVTVPLIGELPVLAAVKEAILPLPEEPNPIDVLSLLHAKVAPVTGEVKVIAPLASPLQRVLSVMALTVGNGLTVIVPVAVTAVQGAVSPVVVTV